MSTSSQYICAPADALSNSDIKFSLIPFYLDQKQATDREGAFQREIKKEALFSVDTEQRTSKASCEEGGAGTR